MWGWGGGGGEGKGGGRLRMRWEDWVKKQMMVTMANLTLMTDAKGTTGSHLRGRGSLPTPP